MIYNKYTSVKNIIAKVYQDLDLKEEEPAYKFLEWIPEALAKIGTFTQLENKPLRIEVHNYRADLPDDLVYLNQLMYNGLPLSLNNGYSNDLELPQLPLPYSQYEEKIDNISLVKQHQLPQQHHYKLVNGTVKVSFEKGLITGNYQAMPLDLEGYPLIPDYEEFREAIYWYINMKWSYAQWRRGEIRDGIYQHAEHEWNWHCQAAASKAMIPDLNMLESIKRNYLVLKPDINKFMTSFNG